MPSLLKMGVIGLGRMGKLYANLLFSQIHGANLYAVAEVNYQARSRAAGELGISHAFADFHELIQTQRLGDKVGNSKLHEQRLVSPGLRGAPRAYWNGNQVFRISNLTQDVFAGVLGEV